MVAAGVLMPAVTPSAAALFDVVAVGTTGERADVDLSQPLRGIEAPRMAPPPMAPLPIAPAPRAAALLTTPRIADAVLPIQPVTLPPPPPQAAAMVIADVRRAEPAVERAVASAPIDESALVRGVLQRYRTAYQDLDAQSAQAVWPAVNEGALARAFNGLESQTLTFDACDVRVNGEAATATCRGSARYVPKVGSRDPRTEPRTWSFTLKKNGADWKIDTARASQ